MKPLYIIIFKIKYKGNDKGNIKKMHDKTIKNTIYPISKAATRL